MSSGMISELSWLQAPRASAAERDGRGLRRPASYPGLVHSVETIETHMSWVISTDDHVYRSRSRSRCPH